MNATTEPVAYSIPAACARMGIARSSLYRELADGHIAGLKARGRTLITAQEIDRWLSTLPKAMLSGGAV